MNAWKSLAPALALLWGASAQAQDAGPLAHMVSLGPGCETVVTMDQLFEIVGTALTEAGARAKDKMDRVEVQCAGALTEDRKGLHAYLTADVLITRKVRYGANIARVLLNRDSRTIQLDAQTEEGLRGPLRGAIGEILKSPLADYAAGRFSEISAAPAAPPSPSP